MAIQDMDAERRYTKYKRHTNDASERVHAETVNSLQKDAQAAQQDRSTIKDTAFQERVYTIFNNNIYANAMFIDPVENGNYIEMLRSSNIELNGKTFNVSLDNPSERGRLYSSHVCSVYGETVGLNDFFIITNTYIPPGASIRWFLRTSAGGLLEVIPNSLKNPLHLHEHLRHGFNVVADIRPNALGESPVINGYAVLYWDEQVDKNLGLKDPDLQRFVTETPEPEDDSESGGLITLVRDRAYDDKLARVLLPDGGTIDLIYNPDNDDRLAFAHIRQHTGTEEDPKIYSQIVKLGYDDYLNSMDETENLVHTIETRNHEYKEGDYGLPSEDYNRLHEEMDSQITDNENNAIGSIGENSGNDRDGDAS